MVLPAAHIGHRTAERIRIKIPSRKGETAYFFAVKEALLKNASMDSLEVNPDTGSVLVKGAQVDVASIASAGEKSALFKLETRPPKVEPLSKKIAAPFHDLGRSINRFSGGELDLQGAAFLGLLGVGLYQLVRGDLKAPPWYVAFWYALGIFTRHILDNKE